MGTPMKLTIHLILFLSIRIIPLTILRQRTHFLSVLLAIEAAVVFTIIILILGRIKTGQRLDPLAFALLTIGVCEAALGLALLVAIVRSHGNDLLKSISVHKVKK